MILSLALRFQKQIALFLLSISFVQVTIAERIGRRYDPPITGVHLPLYTGETGMNFPHHAKGIEQVMRSFNTGASKPSGRSHYAPLKEEGQGAAAHDFIGGPTQPESQAFQSVKIGRAHV